MFQEISENKLMSELSIDTVYSAIRSELLDHSKRISATRSWAIAAVGGASALIANVMAEPPTPGALLEDPNQTIALIAIAGALINLALWTVGLENARGVIRIGAYILYIEKHCGQPRGWEHWVWYRYSAKLRRLREKIFGDVMFWLGLAYLAGTIVLHLTYSSRLSIAAIVVGGISLCLGLLLRSYTHSYRKTAFKEITESWPSENDWFETISAKYNSKTKAPPVETAGEPKAEADG